jgi:hypothetical protein
MPAGRAGTPLGVFLPGAGFGDGWEVAAAVMFGPVDDVEVPLGQFPWGVGERDEYAADSHSSGGSAF